jgi:hypothetical protein
MHTHITERAGKGQGVYFHHVKPAATTNDQSAQIYFIGTTLHVANHSIHHQV